MAPSRVTPESQTVFPGNNHPTIAPTQPETRTVTTADYVNDFAELVALTARRHKLPPGVAFNVAAWAITHLDQKADAAAMRAAATPTPQEDPTE